MGVPAHNRGQYASGVDAVFEKIKEWAVVFWGGNQKTARPFFINTQD
jgi:hypothetical protein